MTTYRSINLLLNTVILLIIGYMMQGCQATTRILSSKSKFARIDTVSAKYVSISAKANYQIQSKDYNCNVRLRIQRDNLIWFSITHIWGIEIMRGRITPTRVELINHIDKCYQVYDYTSLQKDWHIPCNYSLIQATLLGELPSIETKPKTLQLGNNVIIQQQQNFWEYLATVHKDTKKLASLSVVDSLTHHTWYALYEYNKGHQQDFLCCNLTAYFTEFKLSLQYKDVNFSRQPLSFPFNIPQQYDKL